MLFIILGAASVLGAFGTFTWTQANGGTDALANVSGQALTGTMLYGIAALLLVAGVFFIISAVLRTIRKIAATIAVVALLGGGGITAFVPQSVTSYVKDHCPEQVQQLKNC